MDYVKFILTITVHICTPVKKNGNTFCFNNLLKCRSLQFSLNYSKEGNGGKNRSENLMKFGITFENFHNINELRHL